MSFSGSPLVNARVTRRRTVNTTDVYGDQNPSDTYEDITLPCYHQIRSALKQRDDPGRKPGTTQHFFIFDVNADVLVDDQLIYLGTVLTIVGQPNRWDVGIGPAHLEVEAVAHEG